MEALVKYPRTYHLPWSPGTTSDDRILPPDMVDSMFLGKEVVITEKMDGEGTSGYWHGHVHARSMDSVHHVSRSAVKNILGEATPNLPEGWRICGENLYAKHSIFYDRLPSYFLVFSIWNGNRCLDIQETLEWCSLLGLNHVPILYVGVWTRELEAYLKTNPFKPNYSDIIEGYVVRLAKEFFFEDFAKSVAKYVRKGHVQTDDHWLHQAVVANQLGKTTAYTKEDGKT